MARGIGIFLIIIGTILYTSYYSDEDIQSKILFFYAGLVFILIGVILYNFKNVFGKKSTNKQ